MQLKITYKECVAPLLVLTLVLLGISACKEHNNASSKATGKVINTSTPDSGTIFISADESFRPIMEQQIAVYEGSYPNAHLNVVYKPEEDCLKDLENDSVQMIVVSRGLTDHEINYFDYKQGYKPPFGIMAWDAIAVVVNKQSADSMFTKKQLQSIVKSQKASDPMVVTDGEKATSVVRYMADSLVNGVTFGTNIYTTKGTNQVLEYIAAHPNAIGFVGSEWIGQPGTPRYDTFNEKLKTAFVRCNICKENLYSRPSAANIASMNYPFYRPMVVIAKDNALGLSKGFYNFLSSTRGQLVFKQAEMYPDQLNFSLRTININIGNQKNKKH